MARPPSRRALDSVLVATGIAGLLSGAPSTTHALATHGSVLAAVRAAASLVPGRSWRAQTRYPRLADVAAGGLAHTAVSLFWGVVLGRVLPPGRRARWGAAAGVAIHVVDLGLIARLPRLAPMRRLPSLPQLADHIAFGLTFGLVLDVLEPPTTHAGPTQPGSAGSFADDQATSSSAAG